MSEPFTTVRWVGDIDGYLELLDQTRLPSETVYLQCRSAEDVWQAIKRLSVRGAPAIGVAAAYGVCIGIQDAIDKTPSYLRFRINVTCDYLEKSRPTAVNLSWAVSRMQERATQLGFPPSIGPRKTRAHFNDRNVPHN